LTVYEFLIKYIVGEVGGKRKGASLEDRILVVDDEEMICSILARRLAREGYSCVTAHNGKEALNYFYKENFSLIISDIRMPEMDGIELLKKVKAVDPNGMVIMVTAYPEIDLAVEAMRLGAYDFIIKPADLELVVLSVKKALEKKGWRKSSRSIIKIWRNWCRREPLNFNRLTAL
jgi:DNA-binding NtrC family response regulator